ncbi:hypothetical protein C1703_09785 [Streptomyces sp. Go-475]|nr:hypothetical protein C1703_09785 [Streptomyces sp. Go-475]
MPSGSYRQLPLMVTPLGGYGMGSQSWAYQSAAEMVVSISARLTSGLRPIGGGNVPSGTAVMERRDGFQVVPSKSSSDTIRRYRSETSGISVRTDRTCWSSSAFRLSRRDTSGFTAEIVPPPPVPRPAPAPTESSRPPFIAGSPSGTTRAMPSATTPMRRPVRIGAAAPAGSPPAVREAPAKTLPHWESRSRPSASSSIR